MKSMFYTMLQSMLKLDWKESLKTFWMAIRGISRAVWNSIFNRREALKLSALRLGVCLACPFYDSKWKTCGTPGEVQPAITGPDGTCYPPMKIGCWCYLPLATRDPKKDCYARMNDLDIGWPDEIRPKK